MPNEQKFLPAPDGNGYGAVERMMVYPSGGQDGDDSSSGTPFSHYLWLIGRHKWRLLLFVTVAVIATIIVSSRLTPYYQSVATLDVDRMVPNAVIGQEANAGSRVSANDSDTYLSTQIQLIKSDSVLRPVVMKYKLAPPVSPKDPTRGEGPVGLKYLVVARPPKTYLLTVAYRSPDPILAANVANAVAKSYIERSYSVRYENSALQSSFMTKELDELKAKTERSSAALAMFEKGLGITNPEEKTTMLSARLQQLNTEWTTVQADRLKKEAAARAVRGGSLESLQVSDQGEAIRRLGEKIADEAEKFATIKARYGANYPEYKQAATRMAELQQQFEAMKSNIANRIESEYKQSVNREELLHKTVLQTKAESDQLSARSIEYNSLKRDANADRTLYDELNKKIKEAGINSGFQNPSSIRLADPARPARSPIYPRTSMNAVLALLASTFLGIAAILVSDHMDQTIRDPETIQRTLQTEVLGALPVVKAWRGHLPGTTIGPDGKRTEFFGNSGGVANSYEEAVRTLRDSILLPHADQRPKTLLITSATPREGKTTTAVHLAVVHSQQKRKTLIIDSDLRRPGVYHHVGVSNDRGLSNVVTGEAQWRDVLQEAEGLPYLTVLPAGPASRRAADGIGETLKAVLAEAVKEYDLVICDAPPLLGFAESLQIAALVDGVVVVALAGQTEKNAVASVLSSLKRLKANVLGLALNEVRADMSDRYYYYGYYGKYYSRYYKQLDK